MGFGHSPCFAYIVMYLHTSVLMLPVNFQVLEKHHSATFQKTVVGYFM